MRRSRWLAALCVPAVLLTACTAAPAPAPSPTPESAPASGAYPSTPGTSPSPGAARTSGPAPVPLAGDWTATIYYTAVQSMHTGPAKTVKGCPVLDCSRGDTDLGSYPSDFIQAVKDEGTGRITGGKHAGKYLNWSHDVGYWLDTAPRDSHGGTLVPFVSAAADPNVLARGVRLVLTACGSDESGDPVDDKVCARLRQAEWTITDEFTPGLGGSRHIDLYVGEETGPGFTKGPWFITLTKARVSKLPPG
ncbi:hypothetical protein AB0M43_01310 [Longispora sp. NPDC051575]|uniref:hypothetical protein n=1 Tax=Longispora sp. NPDC051575 TaxID=3154943 RepID=UPI0034394F62